MPTTTLALLPDWLDATKILHSLGPYALIGTLLIIFAECGLLVGFFLPGDSLLFTAGLLVANGVIKVPLVLVCLLVVIAACVGNIVGYGIGYRAGPAIFNRPDSRLFKREYVDKTAEFFGRFGARAIVLARFVPIVRTFITVSAGVGRMDFRRYATYTTIGGIGWGVGVTVLGYYLGQIAVIRAHIELMLVAVVLVSVIPIGIELLRVRAHERR
ncbi:MAG TPA: VTT domain-containing protein, partial [Actinopolymorphaceae bacterium]|nr:VTT domain-containing protein [Actinopolymorphaceae bacterium]